MITKTCFVLSLVLLVAACFGPVGAGVFGFFIGGPMLAGWAWK